MSQMLLRFTFHCSGRDINVWTPQCQSSAPQPPEFVGRGRYLYGQRARPERAMACSGDRVRSRSPGRRRFKPIPLAVPRCSCPCGRAGAMIAVEVPPDLPMVPCACNVCGPTAYVGCATRIAPYMQVCGPCRPFWASRAHAVASHAGMRVTAPVNAGLLAGSDNQPQAHSAFHDVPA